MQRRDEALVFLRCFTMFYDVFAMFSLFFDVFRSFSIFFDLFRKRSKKHQHTQFFFSGAENAVNSQCTAPQLPLRLRNHVHAPAASYIPDLDWDFVKS